MTSSPTIRRFSYRFQVGPAATEVVDSALDVVDDPDARAALSFRGVGQHVALLEAALARVARDPVALRVIALSGRPARPWSTARDRRRSRRRAAR